MADKHEFESFLRHLSDETGVFIAMKSKSGWTDWPIPGPDIVIEVRHFTSEELETLDMDAIGAKLTKYAEELKLKKGLL